MLATAFPADDLQRQCQAVCDWAVREGLQGALQFCAYRDGKCIVDVWAGTMTTNVGAAKIDGTSLFPIYSTEKPLLEAAVHRAVEQGKMSYDSPLWTWWPEFKDDGSSGKNDLTLAETLAFRSGMPPRYPKDLFPTVEDECNWRKILVWAASVAPEICPGTKQRYMSVSYAWMLGHPLEVAMGKPLNDVLVDEVLRPCGIENDFCFAAGDAEIPRIVTVYKSKSFVKMNDDRRRRMCMPSAWAVANARAVAKFYNRLCGFDGRPPLLRKETLDYAVRPNRHPDDPIPEDVDEKWYMIFGTGFGLWGERSNLTRVFGHGGLGGSEGLCDRSQRLTVGFTCNFATDVGKVRAKLYGLVGMKWRYWKDAEADIQDIQMKSIGAARFGPRRK